MAEKFASKMEEVALIKEKIQKAKAVIMIDYKGLTVAEDTELRRTLREQGLEYKVLKNTMVRRAFNELGDESFNETLNGPTAFCFGYNDEAATAKTVFEKSKALKDKFNIKAASVEGKFTGAKEVEILASLPSRDQLYAKLMGTLNAPVQQLVSVTQATVTSLLYALNAVKDKKANA